MKAWAVLIVTATLSQLLAGCSEEKPETTLQAFTATLTTPGGTVRTIGLDGPHAILDRDGTTAKAYRISISISGVLGAQQTFVDGAFREIRTDYPCPGGDACDGYVRTNFFNQGVPAPFGIGMNLHTPILNWGSRTAKDIQSEVREGKSAMTIDVQTAISPQLPSGRYTYPSGRLLPDGPLGEVTDYNPGERLEPIPMKEFPTLSLGKRDNDWFPESHLDVIGVGFSPQQFLDGLKEQRPAVNTSLNEGGCIYLVDLSTNTQDQSLPPTHSAFATIAIVSKAGSRQDYSIMATRDFLGQITFTVSDDNKSPGYNCAPFLASPTPRSPQQILDRMGTFPRPAGNRLNFQWIFVDMSDVNGRPPELCYSRYIDVIEPSQYAGETVASFTPYFLEFDACTGWLEGAMWSPTEAGLPPV